MSTAWKSLRRRTATVPRPVWAATLLFAIILATWSSLVPLYEAPDEPGHADLVFHLARGGDYPAYDDREWSEAVRSRCSTFIVTKRWCPPDGEYVVTEQGNIELEFPANELTRRIAGEAPDRRSAPDFEAAGGDRETAQRNQIAQHPPLYYELAGGMVRLERKVLSGTLSLDQELLLVRLLSAAMVMWLPLLAWLTSRRAGLGPKVAVAAAYVPLAIPQLAHIGSVVNNDNLLTLIGAGLIAALAGVIRGDRSTRTAVVTALLLAVGLLTKTSAVVFVPTVVVAYLLGAWRTRPIGVENRWAPHLMAWGQRLVGIGMGVAVLAGWWFVRNRMDHGTFTPSIDDDKLARRHPPAGFVADFDTWWSKVWDVMPGRFWGSPGWFSVVPQRGVVMAASAVVLVAVAAALVASTRTLLDRRRQAAFGPPEAPGESSTTSVPALLDQPTGPVDLLFLLIPFGLTVALVLGRSWRLYETAATILFLQGRYLFASVVGLAVVVAAGLTVVLRRATPLVILVAGALLHLVVVLDLMAVYWGPADADLRTQIYAMVAWTPFPSTWWWLLIGMGGAAGAWALWTSTAWIRGGDDRGDVSGSDVVALTAPGTP